MQQSLATVTVHILFVFCFFNDPATTEIYTLSLHDALPISNGSRTAKPVTSCRDRLLSPHCCSPRSEEHTSELQSLRHLVCRLLLEKKKKIRRTKIVISNRGGRTRI